MFPPNIYQISGDERNEENVGMHITVACISCELTQWQSKRAAQDDKIDTPAHETFIDRHRRPRMVDHVLCGWAFSIWQTHSRYLPKGSARTITLSRSLPWMVGSKPSHYGCRRRNQPSLPVHDSLLNYDSSLSRPSRNSGHALDSI